MEANIYAFFIFQLIGEGYVNWGEIVYFEPFFQINLCYLVIFQWFLCNLKTIQISFHWFLKM